MAKKRVLSQMAILAILESESGLFLEPTKVVPASKSGIWDIDIDKEEIDPLASHQGSKRTEIITDFATVPIKLEGRLPKDKDLIETLFRGCGLVGTIDNNITTFRYSTNDDKTLSFKQVALRESILASGSRGTFTISAKAGESVKVNFDFKGNLHDAVELEPDADDNTIPTTPDFDGVYMAKNCDAITLNGESASLREFEFDLGGDIGVAKETCPGGNWSKDIKPEVKLKMSVTPDNEGAFSDLKSGKEFVLHVPFFDIDGVKKWEFVSPRLVVIENKKPDDEGLLTVERTLECRKVNGDDNFEIKHFA